MIGSTYKNGNIAVKNTDYDKIQDKALRSIKDNSTTLTDMDKISTFDPNVRYQNVVRENQDGSFDIVISAEVVSELPSRVLVKRAYPAIHVTRGEHKGLLNSSAKDDYKIIVVQSTDIVSQFTGSMPIEEVEKLLEATTKKGVNYFG